MGTSFIDIFRRVYIGHIWALTCVSYWSSSGPDGRSMVELLMVGPPRCLKVHEVTALVSPGPIGTLAGYCFHVSILLTGNF